MLVETNNDYVHEIPIEEEQRQNVQDLDEGETP